MRSAFSETLVLLDLAYVRQELSVGMEHLNIFYIMLQGPAKSGPKWYIGAK